MFVKATAILLGTSLDIGNIPAPRPGDAVADALSQAALRAMQAEMRFMSLSERLHEPERYRELQQARRAQLEAFLWTEPNAAAVERMLELISSICAEDSWSREGAPFDDPLHPAIDVQAAETGALLTWLLRRHSARLCEAEPRIVSVIRYELRRRLLMPISAHEDYPFMLGQGASPALVLSDLLFCCLMTERSPARRQQPVKLLLKLLDRCCATPPDRNAALSERLTDACAISDLSRLLKRLTRGEVDLTRSHPPVEWLDGVLIPWIAQDYFFDPAVPSLKPEISGMDVFRLGYLARDRALSALGAQLYRLREQPSASVNGRVLSMEYLRALQDECAGPPKLKRAATENGAILVSRAYALYAALSGAYCRGNAGDFALFCNDSPILAAESGEPFSLPLIDGCAPIERPKRPPQTDTDFTDERDIMSIDLTEAYPRESGLAAFQRTLMTLRGDGSVRLVDAFEFSREVASVSFRFVAALRPLSLRDCVCIGALRLTWDGDMLPEISELPPSPAAPAGRWLLQFTLREPPARLICGFCFEAN